MIFGSGRSFQDFCFFDGDHDAMKIIAMMTRWLPAGCNILNICIKVFQSETKWLDFKWLSTDCPSNQLGWPRPNRPQLRSHVSSKRHCAKVVGIYYFVVASELSHRGFWLLLRPAPVQTPLDFFLRGELGGELYGLELEEFPSCNMISQISCAVTKWKAMMLFLSFWIMHDES